MSNGNRNDISARLHEEIIQILSDNTESLDQLSLQPDSLLNVFPNGMVEKYAGSFFVVRDLSSSPCTQ